MTIPAITGTLLFIYQIVRYFDSYGDASKGGVDEEGNPKYNGMYAFDTPYNAVYGLGVCIWGTIFIESWKRKEAMLQFMWGCSDDSFSPVDERTDDFKFYTVFNIFTD